VLLRFPVLFFRPGASTPRHSNTILGTGFQIVIKFPHPTTDGLLVHPGDVGHRFETPMTASFCFQCHIPAALLFIQTTQKYIHLVMQRFVRVSYWGATDRALALVNLVF
jgi:hypothetical protein